MATTKAVALALALLAALLVAHVHGVDRSKFRTCAQTRFCNKYRTAKGVQAYNVVAGSVAHDAHRVTFAVQDAKDAHGANTLQGSLTFVLDEATSKHPAVRVRLSEKFADENDPKKRWENPDVLVKEAQSTRALVPVDAAASGLQLSSDAQLFKPVNSGGVDVVVALRSAPFGVDLYINKQKVISTNTDHQFHYEIRHDRVTTETQGEQTQSTPEEDVHGGKTIVDYGEDGLAIYSDGTVQQKATPAPTPVVSSDANEGWEESFGGHTDKKKFGPSSVGLDIAFHGQQRGLYGIPEHASDFLLKNTIEGSAGDSPSILTDPYRLYNLDVFEYELNEPMTLYGSIPVLVAPNPENTVGVFWHNPSETFVDIETVSDSQKKSHWLSESGVVDLFLLVGPTSQDFFSQYTLLTGRAQLPPMFAVSYHQCRWNYKNEADVDRVDAGFDEHLIPYDVLWLDIEHTDGKRYFTWDKYAFPSPLAMQERVARVGRKMVTIVDPHIKRDDNYYVHQEATAKGYYIKDENGKDFNGWCWPGDSSYVDFTSPAARQWWSTLFRYDKYQQSSKDLYTWNDMNEPSVFNGPEVSMRKTCANLDGVEHREWHNMYGYYMQWATMDGQLMRQLPPSTQQIELKKDMQRPFVLSRAFFAGSQRFGAIWTGDNKADWGHLKYATKMLLSMSVSGLTFVGADVGGFFGNPDTELLTRWYQAAAYQPFFRGHAHHDSDRREPWVHGEKHTSRIRAAIRQRYALLPYVYTLFHDCTAQGQPVMRPLWMHFPQDAQSFLEEDEFMLGEELLVKPIVEQGVTATNVFLPGKDAVWYHVTGGYKRFAGGVVHNDVPAPIEATPVFQRGGSIIPRKNRVRRSSALMRRDPITLVVALDANLEANGKLYVDDEDTFAFEVEQQFSEVEFQWTRAGLKSTWTKKQFASKSWVERIEVVGFQSADKVFKKVTLNGQDVGFHYNAAEDRVVIRKPSVVVTSDWELKFAF
ncbi:TPA: hypothetical protein N0F65_010404 [Lagenidium giganteum]|uniref:Glucosidase II subunit alpha n=1 Tax=Lagenidium giganteum TaxID=4803 RepID=A0AAV2YVJ7_9STRA|nr:TPA: hypothetical protein N0F65_010404 [Lagenidium giganteum]